MEQKIPMESFYSFMLSPAGRWARALVGLSLISYGLSQKRARGYAIAALGMEPLAAGVFDLCLMGAFYGGSIRGDQMRRALHHQRGFPQMSSKSANWASA